MKVAGNELDIGGGNLLLRGAQSSHPLYSVALAAQVKLRSRGEPLCLVAQNLVEFRAVATRPLSVNGLGMSQVEADTEITRIKSLYRVFVDDPAILSEWESLVSLYGAQGKQNHDARIVAAMQVHGITKILTFNKMDFVRYPNLTVLTPLEVLALP